MTTSYANSGGTGNRTATITASTDITVANGPFSTRCIDGDTTTNVWWFNAGESSKYMKWDFGSQKVIDAFKWYQNVSAGNGVWKWFGSNDDSSYTALGSTFTLDGTSTGSEITEPSGNTTAYRYYKMVQQSGTTSPTPYQREIEFKIENASVTGALAATETGDTAAFTGSVAWNAALAVTETNDTAALTGSVTNNITGTLATTEANDELQFDFQLQAQLDATETNDAASLTGSNSWTGALTTTEAADTGALTGQVTTQPTGTLAATEQKDTAALAGYVAIAGTLGAIETSDVAAFNGQGLPVTGTLATTEAADILVFNEPDVYSLAMATIEDADTAAFVGTFKRHSNVVVIVCNN